MSLQLDYPNAGIYDELYFTGLAIQTDANGLVAVKPSMSKWDVEGRAPLV